MNKLKHKHVIFLFFFPWLTNFAGYVIDTHCSLHAWLPFDLTEWISGIKSGKIKVNIFDIFEKQKSINLPFFNTQKKKKRKERRWNGINPRPKSRSVFFTLRECFFFFLLLNEYLLITHSSLVTEWLIIILSMANDKYQSKWIERISWNVHDNYMLFVLN